MLSHVSYAANISSKTVDTIVLKLTVLMQKDPLKFEQVVTRFYDVMEKSPTKLQYIFQDLIIKINDLVDRYNASITTTSLLSFDKISAADLNQLLSFTTWEATGSSDIAILEFSDFECPFCKRHFINATLKTVMDTFPGKLSKAYLHFPLSFHPMAAPTAIASECIKSQLWKDWYYHFVETIFSNTGTLTPDYLSTVVSNMNTLDKNLYTSCISDPKLKDFVYTQMDFWSRVFQIRGTPANVLLNIKTGEYILISWAVPSTTIIDAVKKLLK